MKGLLPKHGPTAIILLWWSQLIAAAMAFATHLLLVRGLSVEDYGALATALASVALLTPIAGFGIGAYWLRVFGKEGWAAQRWVRPTLRLVIIFSVLTIIATLAWARSGTFSDNMRTLMTILVITVFSESLESTGHAVFQLEGRYLALALYQILPRGLRFLVAILAFWLGYSAFGVATGYAIAASVMVMVYSRVLWHIVGGRLALQGHGTQEEVTQPGDLGPIPSVLTAVRDAWPFGLAGLFYLIYFKSDIALLGMLAGEKAAGIYNVAFIAMTVVYLFPSAVYQQYFLPHLHRWAEHDQDRFLQIYQLGGQSMLIMSLGFMGLVGGLAPWVAPWLFGETYREAGILLTFLSLCIPLHFLATNVGSVLTTGGNMRRKIRYQGIAVVFNVALNLVLIPVWGVFGAAVATLSTESFVLLIYTLGVMRHAFGKATLNALEPPTIWISVLICMVAVAFAATRPNSIPGTTGLVLGSLTTTSMLYLKYLRHRFHSRLEEM